MNYSLEIKPQAKEDLKNLDVRISRRIKDKLEGIKNSPEHYLKWINEYKVHVLRVGKHRVFIDLNKKEKIIEILVIRHRDKAYRGWR